MLRRIVTTLILMSCLCPAASAADDIVLRAVVRPAEVWVGQRVVLQVDVLGAQGWAQVARFPDVELPGAYLMRTDSRSTRLQETIQGVAYTGERYEFSIFPQRAGVIEVPSLAVDVTVSAFGVNAAQTVQQSRTPAVTIDARLPPGAAGIRGLISSARLSVEQEWDPAIDQPRVGDALERTLLMQVDDVSGMAFVPLQHAELPGIGVYPAEPEVSDRIDRGALTGFRTERVTYVFERAGTARLPAFSLTWWNVSDERLETLVVPGREFEVIPGPATAAEMPQPGAEQGVRSRGLWLPGVLLLAGALIIARYRQSLGQHWEALRRRQRHSESSYFHRALDAIRAGGAGYALREIMRWLDRIDEHPSPAQLGDFVRRYGDSRAEAAIEQLLEAVAAAKPLPDPAQLLEAMKSMRMRYRNALRQRTDAATALPGLNERR